MKFNNYILLATLLGITSLPTQGMSMITAQARNALAKQAVASTKVVCASMGAKPLAIKSPSFSSKSIVALHNQKFNRDRSNVYSLLYGGGLLATLGIWLGVTQQNQEKAIKQEREDAELKIYKPLFFEARAKYDEYLLSRPWGEVSSEYIKWRNDTAKELENELLGLIGYSKQEWLKFCRQEVFYFEHFGKERFDKDALESQGLLIPANLNSAIVDGLRLASINPAAVKWQICLSMPSNAIMGAERSFISISKRACSDCQDTVSDDIKLTIMHEIQHLLWDDGLRQVAANIALKEQKVDVNIINNYILKLRRFHEKRSDIFGSLADIKLVTGGVEELRYYPEWPIRDYSKDVHYPPAAQFAYLSKLFQQMEKPYTASLKSGTTDSETITSWI
ncbi:MAG: hypothetical protein P4L31_04185 [Candidatus Babeliales bacterium]|nr:hypothetical protein [Candidatus Babeliales bacterium]